MKTEIHRPCRRSARALARKAAIACLCAATLTGCLDETFPTEGMTQDQVNELQNSDGLVNAITVRMNTIVNSDIYGDVGYPTIMIHRDVMGCDMPVRDPGYYYFRVFANLQQLGDWATQSAIYTFYTKLVQCSNLCIGKLHDGDGTNLATALAYRAFANMEMAELYESTPTGTGFDRHLTRVKGLTVPIMTETTTEDDAFANPRAPYYKMWRYILTDLRKAEAEVRSGGDSPEKTKASLSMVKGLQARLWLTIATRFDRFPDDLAETLAHEGEGLEDHVGYALDPIGVTTAYDAYAKAAECAAAAIPGHTPLTKAEWHDPVQGFNSSEVSSWIWSINMSSSDIMASYYTWRSWVSFMAPEATYGVASSTYKASHMIDRNLYERIDPADWRRLTWIDPDLYYEGEQAFKDWYEDKTTLTYSKWALHVPYVGFKFRPGMGNGKSSTTGNCVDIPLMRVEEMYFIEAEALAHTQGVAAGVDRLTTFLNVTGARYSADSPYSCSATTLDDFIDELIFHKRVELWGEGRVYSDFRRLGLAVTRGYEDTNHPEAYRYNAPAGYTAAWHICFIPTRENSLNAACELNGDPTEATTGYLWK